MAVNEPLVWLRGEIKKPPMSTAARLEADALLRRLQRGRQEDTRDPGGCHHGLPHAIGDVRPVIGRKKS
jgi:hypothetical protein